MKKRILSMLLLICMVVSVIPTPVVAASKVDSMNTVYVDTTYGVLGQNATENDPTSWKMGVQWVADGGTIYLMGDSITVKTEADAQLLTEQSAKKAFTIKPYHGTRNDKWLENPILKIQNSVAATLNKMTFDGSTYGETYNYDILYVDSGTLTLNECTVKGSKNTSYGAAIGIYYGATVNLNNSIVENNHCGTKRGSGTAHAGGITAAGNLNVTGTSRITGNRLYDDADHDLDILVDKRGTVKIDGAAKIGVIGFAANKTNDTQVYFTSALQNNIYFRKHNYMNIGGNYIFMETFMTGNPIAKGTNGYTLTANDIAKMSINNGGGTRGYHVDLNEQKQAYVNRDCTVYLSGSLDTTKGSFRLSSKPSGHVGRPLGKQITIAAAPVEGYRYKPGTMQVISYNDRNVDYTQFLVQVSGKAEWTLNIPDDIILYAEFELDKAKQTVSDPGHADGDSYRYTLVAGEDTEMPLDMENNTAFGETDTAPDPLLSFALQDPASDVIRLDGNKIIPLKVGTVTVTATAAETDSHDPLVQEITVDVVRSLSMDLISKDYTQSVGLTFAPSYTDGTKAPYTINDDTRFLGIRKVGETNITEIPKTDWSWNTDYTQSFAGLEADTEYEIVFRTKDNRPEPKTAETVLRFKTPKAGSTNTGAIEGTVEGTGDITVRVEYGNTVIATKEGLHTGDSFSFKNLPDGFYNLVANNQDYSVTIMVEVANGGTTTLQVVVVGEKQSTVKVEPGAPPVAADKLGELFQESIYTNNSEATDAVDGGGTVEIRLTAENPDRMGEDKIPVEAIENEADQNNKTVGMLVNLNVDMIITPSDGAISKTIHITDTGTLIEIALPLPLEAQGKTGYQVLRYHGADVQVLKEIAPSDTPVDESFYVYGGYAHIFAQNFSTYAIAYTETFTIQATAHEGGTISPSGAVEVVKNGNKNFTITPNAGMKIDKVLVDGAKVRLNNNQYTFSGVTENHTIEAFFAKDEQAVPSEPGKADTPDAPAEGKNATPGDISSPGTGDSSHAGMWLSITTLSLLGLIICDRLRKQGSFKKER